MKNYYTYIHLIDGKPIYVGEGSRGIDRAHHKYSRSPEHEKLLKEGDVDVVIVGDHSDKVSAELNEQGLISWIGLPNLLNKIPYQNAGFASYGFAGKKHTDEWKKQASKRQRGTKKNLSQEKLQELRDRFRGVPISEERRLRIIATKETNSITCPHCKMRGTKPNMERWHFDKCKLHPNRITDTIHQAIDHQIRLFHEGLECPHCGKVGTGISMKRWHFDNCKHKP